MSKFDSEIAPVHLSWPHLHHSYLMHSRDYSGAEFKEYRTHGDLNRHLLPPSTMLILYLSVSVCYLMASSHHPNKLPTIVWFWSFRVIITMFVSLGGDCFPKFSIQQPTLKVP